MHDAVVRFDRVCSFGNGVVNRIGLAYGETAGGSRPGRKSTGDGHGAEKRGEEKVIRMAVSMAEAKAAAAASGHDNEQCARVQIIIRMYLYCGGGGGGDSDDVSDLGRQTG